MVVLVSRTKNLFKIEKNCAIKCMKRHSNAEWFFRCYLRRRHRVFDKVTAKECEVVRMTNLVCIQNKRHRWTNSQDPIHHRCNFLFQLSRNLFAYPIQSRIVCKLKKLRLNYLRYRRTNVNLPISFVILVVGCIIIVWPVSQFAKKKKKTIIRSSKAKIINWMENHLRRRSFSHSKVVARQTLRTAWNSCHDVSTFRSIIIHQHGMKWALKGMKTLSKLETEKYNQQQKSYNCCFKLLP